MEKYYTDEVNAQIIIVLLKAHGIRKVIASPGTTNMALVASMDSDPFFEMYSAVDERSAAYMACGLAAESGEPVVISCTGATASRNYASGLTEAYYRKLPILAITSIQSVSKVGHHVAQVIDRSSIQKDIAKLSIELPFVKDAEDQWSCEVKVNQAILELRRHGGGPVHLNLPTSYSKSYDTKELPAFRKMERIVATGLFPYLPKGKVAVLIGSHAEMTVEQTETLDRFCAANDAVVFCDHTSGYHGQYRMPLALVGCQLDYDISAIKPDLLIHIGEVTGDYYVTKAMGREVWRVSEDGEIRDTFRKLRYVFEMSEQSFFQEYTQQAEIRHDSYFNACREVLQSLRQKMPDLPLSNPWIASQTAHRIPESSTIHFGILNSLRSWNFFDLPKYVTAESNVGGFGIDGGLSSLIGASLSNSEKLYFCVIGDLAFFYDMNSIGNRHVGRNIRILLVNNGKGTEFRHTNHPAGHFGEAADRYIAADGHFGQKSPTLVKHYAEDLGFEYLQADSKASYGAVVDRFLVPEVTDRPMLLEVFTNSEDESAALASIMEIEVSLKGKTKQMAKQVLGKKGIGALKRVIKR
jgi:2-succinyl-5-enolpyruvyl-6-hydroxy-3-cyclohexene-1-carboxylate synthase